MYSNTSTPIGLLIDEFFNLKSIQPVQPKSRKGMDNSMQALWLPWTNPFFQMVRHFLSLVAFRLDLSGFTLGMCIDNPQVRGVNYYPLAYTDSWFCFLPFWREKHPNHARMHPTSMTIKFQAAADFREKQVIHDTGQILQAFDIEMSPNKWPCLSFGYTENLESGWSCGRLMN